MTNYDDLEEAVERCIGFHDAVDLEDLGAYAMEIRVLISEYRQLFGVAEQLRIENEACASRLHEVATVCATAEQERDALKVEVEAFKVANAELSEINVARRNHLSNAKKAAGIGPMDDLVGTVEALRKAALEVLSWTEAKHRPPVADELECGRMVLVRLHALADLHAILSKEADNG